MSLSTDGRATGWGTKATAWYRTEVATQTEHPELTETRSSRSRSPLTSVLEQVRQHPVIATVLVASTLSGAVLGAYFLTGEWSLARRILGGAVAGAGTGLLITTTKMIG